jgi:hypothetical protein
MCIVTKTHIVSCEVAKWNVLDVETKPLHLTAVKNAMISWKILMKQKNKEVQKMEQMNFWVMEPAENINKRIAELPTATEVELIRADTKKVVETRKAIVVNDTIVNTPTEKYVLVQHEGAFRPIVEGLTVSGVKDFTFSLWHTLGRANLNIMIGEAKDGVKYGFKITNSYDGSHAIRFGYEATKRESYVEIVEKEHVTLWGYRQVCSNGLKIKVPLKSVKYLDAVQRERIKVLLGGKKSMKHLGSDLKDKVTSLQYVVEAMLLLKGPLNMMIIDAQRYKLNKNQAEKLIEKYVMQRKIDMFMDQFESQRGNDLWSLYNAVTWIASHRKDLSIKQRERYMDKASNLLTGALLAKIKQ